MTLRSELPSGTPDPYIAHLAESTRVGLEIRLNWMLDPLKVKVGLARVLGRDEDSNLPARLVPTITDATGQNWCVLVVDTECEHGLSAELCEGPQHYPLDRDEMESGLFQ